MLTRRRYSIVTNGDLTVTDWPGDPTRRVDISNEYQNVGHVRPAQGFARVEASIAVDIAGTWSCTQPQTLEVVLSLKELLEQAQADLDPGAVPPRSLQ
jgi:hypothetical protein